MLQTVFVIISYETLSGRCVEVLIYNSGVVEFALLMHFALFQRF